MLINLHNLINSSAAISAEDGDIIYEHLNKLILELQENNSSKCITIDFSGIEDLTTAFLNNGIAKLFLNFDYQFLVEHIHFSGFSKGNHIKLLKLSLANALNNLN